MASSRVLPAQSGVTPHVMTPLWRRRGRCCVGAGNTEFQLQELFERGSRLAHLEHVPARVARRRACPRVPKCTRLVPAKNRNRATTRQHNMPICRTFVQALRRTRSVDPPPYHGGFGASRAYTRDHSRRTFSCNRPVRWTGDCVARRPACSLMCPFCLRGSLSVLTTKEPRAWMRLITTRIPGRALAGTVQ